jgi:hypothetical protein
MRGSAISRVVLSGADHVLDTGLIPLIGRCRGFSRAARPCQHRVPIRWSASRGRHLREGAGTADLVRGRLGDQPYGRGARPRATGGSARTTETGDSTAHGEPQGGVSSDGRPRPAAFLRAIWRNGIEFVTLDLEHPETLPVSPRAVIDDNIAFRPSLDATRATAPGRPVRRGRHAADAQTQRGDRCQRPCQ